MSDLLNYLRDCVLLCDGAMGSLVQAMDLDVEADFLGRENCTEVLNLSRPDVVRSLHERYYEAGADLVETNSFGGSPITLAEFGLQDQAFEINRRAAEIAREAAERFKGDGRARFVLGAIGPGTKLPSLGHVDYDSLESAFTVQASGLIAGGCDAVLIETCQDPLQIKAAVNGTKQARKDAGATLPLIVQATVETTGTLLVGSDIGATATVLHALGVDGIGMNCATGPSEMAEHLAWLAENWPGLISIQPNAGLPELRDGKACYPLTPGELADWHRRFLREDGVNIVGSCCGSTPEHTAAVDAMLRREGKGFRPAPLKRSFHWIPAIASLYARVEYRQENAFLSIGERCNANGSKKFRQAQEAEDWDAILAMGREQIREGSHALDVSTAFVGRDEGRDMDEVVSRFRGAVNAPLVIDSTETPVIERALKLYGGKAIVNSINFEDGERQAEDRVRLALRFGAGVTALTIDEQGMAKTCADKVRIALRLHDFACARHGLPASDLMIDPLTFTICTGVEDDRRLGVETLDAIEQIAAALPECQIVLGLSNISFGLKPAARQVLNSVFLHHALKRGMSGAIVHVSKILPLHTLAPHEVAAAEDLIFDRRREGRDPLHAFIALFGERADSDEPKDQVVAATVEERLRQRIVEGNRQGLEADLEEALKTYPPLDIVNVILLDGMKTVGELFGEGRMQLPFVLQAAETMKAAVAWLEPRMEKAAGRTKGTLVLATVKGDVHDIGKNLVDIILSNNGYKVVNLGIKQPISSIIAAAREHKADAIGMSGLLVKSTAIMKENLEELVREGISTPVILGGAALTRAFVETDCSEAYAPGGGGVAYARDAFDGLNLMGKAVGGAFSEHLASGRPRRAKRASARAEAKSKEERPVDWEEIAIRRQDLARLSAVPRPPFWGPRLIEKAPLKTLLPYLNETMLFQFQWGFKKQGRDLSAWREWARSEVTPILNRMLERCEREGILQPKAAYGYWKAASEGDAIILFDEDGTSEAARFSFPRQPSRGGLCLADFVREKDSGERDVIGLQAATVGEKASETARAWFSADSYQDYLYLHGLSVETTEALAEYVHKRMRAELGFASEDARDPKALLKQEYRGARYSFGYPACPNLADQRRILSLLGAERLGISLSEEDQLHPEQSTSAIVLFHPQAKYFRI